MQKDALEKYIFETYGIEADHPFEKYPSVAVFRHQNNKKWFAALMTVEKSKFQIPESGVTDIVNLKCDPLLSGSLILEEGIYEAYHMNKNHWISFLLEKGDDEKLKWLLDLSYTLTKKNVKAKNTIITDG